MALHESLNPARRTGSASDSDGRWVPIGGRTGSNYTWDITIDVGDVESGTVTPRVEAAMTRADDDVVVLHTFSAVGTPARLTQTLTLSGYLGRGFIRSVANINGTVTIASTEKAAFFNVTAESGRINRQVQNWNEISEAATKAEADLLTPYRRDSRYWLNMDGHGFSEDIRDSIAEQVQHRFQLMALSKGDTKEQLEARRMGAVDSDAKKRVAQHSDFRTVYF